MNIEEYSQIFKEYPKPAGQHLWAEDFDAVIVHTRGKFPKKIIENTRPNEPSEVRDYRISIFEPVTRDPFQKVTTNIQRTVSHSSVEVILPEQLKPYLEGPNFRGVSFMAYMQKYVVKKMLEAANGLLVWWPENIVDVNTRVTMKPIVVMPDEILHYDDDVLTFLSKEKSLVTRSEDEVPIGEVYYVILKDGLYKRVQVGKVEDKKFVFEAYYSNPIGEIYALILGGDEISAYVKDIEQEVTYFTSFISSAIPYANECLRRHSDNQGTWVTCASPIREVEAQPCTSCKNGYVDSVNKFGVNQGRRTCGSCNGSGQILPTTSYGYIVRPQRNQVPGDNPQESTRKAIEFLHPEVSILEYGGKSWQDYLRMAKDALNLIFTDEAQSGVAKDIDREDKLSTLDKIGVHLYRYLITQSINIIHKFMFPAQAIDPVQINLPITFIIKKESDIVDEINKLRQANAPDVMLGEVLRELMTKKYGGDPYRMKLFDIVMAVDPLATRTANEKRQDLASNAISERDYQFSSWAYPTVNSYARVQNDFVNMDIGQAINEVAELINQKVDTLAQAVMDRNSSMFGQVR